MKIAVIQLCSKLEPQHNLKTIRGFLEEAKKRGARAVFLPEVYYSMSDGTKPTPYLIEDQNEHYQAIKKLAQDFGVYLLGGSVATKVKDKIMNRSYNFDPSGKEIAQYDKINLFSCDLSRHNSQQIIDEGKVYTSGNKPQIIDVDQYKLGLAICFDLRFPELFRYYSSLGCQLISVSSAFTQVTGKAHWHALLKARAIENQSYIIASAQWGVHNERMKTFGHSLVIDPWGDILVDAGGGEKIVFAEINSDRIAEVRSRLNVIKDPRQLFV